MSVAPLLVRMFYDALVTVAVQPREDVDHQMDGWK
jgi:hypothetical protein